LEIHLRFAKVFSARESRELARIKTALWKESDHFVFGLIERFSNFLSDYSRQFA
jgi:hypothetical protein